MLERGRDLTRIHGNLLDRCHWSQFRDGDLSTPANRLLVHLDLQSLSSTWLLVPFVVLVHGHCKSSLGVHRSIAVKARRLPPLGEELILSLSFLLHLSRIWLFAV